MMKSIALKTKKKQSRQKLKGLGNELNENNNIILTIMKMQDKKLR